MHQFRLCRSNNLDTLEVKRADGSITTIKEVGLAEHTIYRYAVEKTLNIEGPLFYLANSSGSYEEYHPSQFRKVDAIAKAIIDYTEHDRLGYFLQNLKMICDLSGIEPVKINVDQVLAINSEAKYLLAKWMNLKENESLEF